ncbi:MAG: immune inhibitor A [Acidimicrobiales bacterium]|nr:immune inhibitor A [Acidimicrobiales bacterium]
MSAPHGNLDASHTAVLGEGTITISGTGFGPMACSDCHTSPLLTTIHPAGCVTCHPTAKDSLIPVWDKSCVQGECHTVDSAAPMHAAVDVVHVIPAERADCLASGCHGAGSTVPLAGKSVADIHSNATTTTAGGQTRTSCQICHAVGETPTTDCATSGCHADRTAPHGYVATRHVANESCIGTCHGPLQGLTELGPIHNAVAAPVACSGCHPVKMAEVYPWDKTCAACHAVSGLHPAATQSHVSTDVAYQAASSFGNGCSNSTGASGQSNCHDISSLTSLHSGMEGSGCAVCHGIAKTPAAECLDCHSPGYATTYGTSPTVGTHTYHGDNVKYLHDPSDAPAGQRFAVNPAHGWYNALYNQDCYDFCHRGNGGAPAFSAPQGSWMWYSVGGDPTDAVTATRKLTLKTITVPTGSATLNFDTNYQLGTGAAGYVEISTNDGTSWTRLTGTVGGVSRPSVTGSASGWVPASYNLSAYAGQSVKLRFRYVNGSSTSAGWAFDSLTISGSSGTVFSDDAETLKPDWTNSFWTRAKGAFHQ